MLCSIGQSAKLQRRGNRGSNPVALPCYHVEEASGWREIYPVGLSPVGPPTLGKEKYLDQVRNIGYDAVGHVRDEDGCECRIRPAVPMVGRPKAAHAANAEVRREEAQRNAEWATNAAGEMHGRSCDGNDQVGQQTTDSRNNNGAAHGTRALACCDGGVRWRDA